MKLFQKQHYSANRLGSVATTYEPQRGAAAGSLATLKFFLTNSGDVLRGIYLLQDDPFVEKAEVLLTLLCGCCTLVHKLPWQLWTAHDQHPMANRLALLDSAGRAVRLPMINISQDCLLLTVTLPQRLTTRNKWRVVCVWDFMTRDWRSDSSATPFFADVCFPVPQHVAILNGQMRAGHTLPPSQDVRRHSNPLM